MKRKTKARIALALAAMLAAGAIGAAATMWTMTYRATNFEADPQRTTQQHEATQGATGNESATTSESIDWDYWQSINPDVIGWITVPNTGIDCPIVQAGEIDPTYYLTHDVYGSWNYHGAPYLSCQCTQGGLLGSKNALVFGHHLLDGTMFSELVNLISEDQVIEHSPIVLQTPQANATLTVLAVDRINANDETAALDFADDAAFKEWLATTVQNADLTLAATKDLEQVTNVVTLCTCSYTTWNNERTLVICSVNAKEAN